MRRKRRQDKPRRQIRPTYPPTREEALAAQVMGEYSHKKTGARVQLIELGHAKQTMRLFHYESGRRTWVSFETLYRNYKLLHRGVRAKVGTGPGTLITLLQRKAPEEGDYVKFVELLNGPERGGYVDEIRQVDGEPLYVIMRF